MITQSDWTSSELTEDGFGDDIKTSPKAESFSVPSSPTPLDPEPVDDEPLVPVLSSKSTVNDAG